jgi:hypothetical protein
MLNGLILVDLEYLNNLGDYKMVKGFDIGLTERQGKLVEEALRKHLTFLNEQRTLANMLGDSKMSLEYDSSANVVRNTLAQVKDGLYSIQKENV